MDGNLRDMFHGGGIDLFLQLEPCGQGGMKIKEMMEPIQGEGTSTEQTTLHLCNLFT